MSTDLMVQVRDYLDLISEPVDVSEVVDAPIEATTRRHVRPRSALGALATGVAVVAVSALLVLLIRPANVTPNETMFTDQITTVVTSDEVDGRGAAIGVDEDGALCAIAGTTSERESRCDGAAPIAVAFLAGDHLAVAGYVPTSAVEVTLMLKGVHRGALELAPVSGHDLLAFANVSQIAASDAEIEIEVKYSNGDVERFSPVIGYPMKSLGFQVTNLPVHLRGRQIDTVWMGTELLVFDRIESQFAAYDPAEDAWRELPPAPGPFFGADPIWTGTEVLVCCGGFFDRSDPVWAYDPVSDSWHEVAPPPGFLSDAERPRFGPSYPTMVWTGSLAVGVTFDVVGGYDPTHDEWVEYQPVPAGGWEDAQESGWTGTEVIVWPKGDLTKSGGYALDPQQGTWRELPYPSPTAWPYDVEMAVTGDYLVIWGPDHSFHSGTLDRVSAVGSQFDVSAGEWAEIPSPVPPFAPCDAGDFTSKMPASEQQRLSLAKCGSTGHSIVWTGETVLVSTGQLSSGASDLPLLLAYDPDDGSWSYIAESPTGPGAQLSMAGDRVALVGPERLYISPPGWQPNGEPMPSGGLLSTE